MKKFIGIILIVIFMVPSLLYAGSTTASGVIASTIITETRREMAEEGYVDYYWSDTEMIQWMNQAVKTISSKTKCLESSRVTMNLTANQWVYSLSAYNFTDVEAILHDSGDTTSQTQVFSLARTQIAAIGHTTEKGRPKDYCIWNNELILWPIPNSTQSGTTIYLYMTAKPSGVTTSTSPIETPHYFDDAIISYVKAQAFYKDLKFQVGDYFMRQFDAKLDEYIVKIIKRTP